MKRQTPQPKWGLLFMLMPVYVLLAWIFTRLALTGTLLEAAQIGTLLLIFFLANLWIGENEPVFSMAKEEERVQKGLKRKSGETEMAPRKDRFGLVRVGRSLLAALIVVAATLVMALIGRSLLGEGVIALLYLFPIGWTTVRWGRIAGASAALSAALCFDFFFIVPYFTFRVGSLEGWLLLALFMGMSLVVVGKVMTLFSDAKKREDENNFLYEMIILMADQQTRAQIAEFVATQFLSHYQAGLVKVVLYQRGGQPSVLIVRNGSGPQPTIEPPERSLPFYSGPELIGKISIAQAAIPLPADDNPMLQSICRLVALAVDRAQTAPAWESLGRPQQSHAS